MNIAVADMQESEVLCSIIIPHFNSLALLEKCLLSIPNIKEFQVIVVDDKSEERQFPLDDLRLKYSQKNIEFYRNTTQHKGAGVCRNIGLKKAEGKWLLFADADDFFTDDFQDIIFPYFHTDADIIFFPPTSIDLESGKLGKRHKIYCDMIKAYCENPSLNTELSIRYGFSVPWSKLIRSSVIKEYHIQFAGTMVANDVMFSTKTAYYSKKIIAANTAPLYCVTESSGTLTTIKNLERFNIRNQVFVEHCNFLREHLTKREYRLLGLNGSRRLHDVQKYKYGFKEMLYLLRLFRKNKIAIIEWNRLKPIVQYRIFTKRIAKLRAKEQNE